MGDMIRCPKCSTFHYRNDPCPDDHDEPTPEKKPATPISNHSQFGNVAGAKRFEDRP